MSTCHAATHDLRRFHGGCHHGPDGWRRLSQNYMKTTCFTHRGHGPSLCVQTCVDKLGQDDRFYRRYDSTTWHRRWTVASWAPCAAAEGRCAC